MSTCLLNTSRDGDSTTSLGSLFQCLTTLSVKKFFLTIQSKRPLVQLEAVSVLSKRPVLRDEHKSLFFWHMSEAAARMLLLPVLSCASSAAVWCLLTFKSNNYLSPKQRTKVHTCRLVRQCCQLLIELPFGGGDSEAGTWPALWPVYRVNRWRSIFSKCHVSSRCSATLQPLAVW